MVFEKALKYYEKGLALLKKESFNKAAKEFTEAIKLNPNFAAAYYYRGFAFSEKGNHFKAFDDLLTAIGLDSSWGSKPYTHPLYQALVHETRNEFKQALAIYDVIIQSEPKLAIVYCRQGYCYYCLGNYSKAIECYTAAIEVKEGIPTIYYNRAIAYEDLANEVKSEITNEEFEKYLLKALDDYTKAIELAPGDSQSVNNRGLVYFYLGEYQKAIDDLSVSIEANPTRAVAYDFRGCAFKELGEFEKAVADHTNAIKLEPTDPIIFYNRALVWIEKGEVDNAAKDLREALKLEPNYTDAKVKLMEIDA